MDGLPQRKDFHHPLVQFYWTGRLDDNNNNNDETIPNIELAWRLRRRHRHRHRRHRHRRLLPGHLHEQDWVK